MTTIVKIQLPSWIGTKTYLLSEKKENKDHREKSFFTYTVISRHTFTNSGEEIITHTGKGTEYLGVDIIEMIKP